MFALISLPTVPKFRWHWHLWMPQMNLWTMDSTGLSMTIWTAPTIVVLQGGITFVVVLETAKRISSKWSDAFLMGDCRSRAHSIPSLFYGRADFSSVRRR
ncbi:hypothetical protein Tco_0493253 [Tanacetum coccineum]